MKNELTYTRGIGVTAVVVIVAVLAVGGYATVRAVQNSRVDIDTKAMEEKAMQQVLEVKADAESTLSQVQADLRANANLAVDATITALTDLSARIESAALTVESDARAELNELKAEVDALRAKVQTNVSEAQADLQATLEDIQVDLEVGAHAMLEGEHSHDDEGHMMETEGEAMQEKDGSMEEGESMQVEGEAGVEATAGDEGADAEGDASVEVNL